jgi:inner membrane protein
MENNNVNFFSRKSTQLTMKTVLIGLLTLLLLIPRAIIQDLIYEREKLGQSVVAEVSAGWGGDQILTGPVIVIPYLKQDKDKNKVKNYSIYLPKQLKVSGGIATTLKHRSIYEVNLYQSNLKLTGSFDLPASFSNNAPNKDLLLNEAFVAIGIKDLKGIQSNVTLKWNDLNLPMKSGMDQLNFHYNINVNNDSRGSFSNSMDYNSAIGNTPLATGLSVPLNLKDGQTIYNFDMMIDLKGSSTIQFAPLAANTEVTLKSSFKDPSFIGNFLPDNTVNNSGFTATWKISEYNRNIPNVVEEGTVLGMDNNLFGIRLESSVDNYAKTNRAVKYMLLIIALTFLVVFLTEIIEKKKIHIFQYTLTGLALAIFYTLLLAFSEIISFDLSYLISAIAIIILLYLYSLSLFKNKKSAAVLFGMTSLLFGYIYSIIQLEKTALLFGAIGLFVIIAATMYATRKINWYEEEAARVD